MNGVKDSDEGHALEKMPRPEVIEKVIDVQLKQIELQHEELSVRKDELEFQKQQSRQGFEYANRVLDANVDDLKTVRTNESVSGVRTTFVLILILLLSFGFLFFALWQGKEQIIFEILEKLAYIVGGGGAVIIYNKVKQKKEETAFDEEEIE